MSVVYILPTYTIVAQFKEFENLFTFYDEGIKGVIRDAVILSAAYNLYDYPESLYHPPKERTNGLRDKVLADYDQSLEAKWSNFELSRYPNNTILIEIIVDKLEDAVEQMMRGIFRRDIYDVAPGGHKWIGNDLAIGMEIHL